MSRDWTHLFLCLPPAASLCCSVDCPLEQSIGRQHHSSVISMETSSSRGNDWAPSQSLLFCDRAMEAVLPTPSSQRHSPSYTHTHIFPFVLFLHLYGAVTEMGLRSRSGFIASGWNAFWYSSISEDRLAAEESACRPHLRRTERTGTGVETC